MSTAPTDSNALPQSVESEVPPEYRVDAPKHDGGIGDPLCLHCGHPFKPAPRCAGRQKFGSDECRNAHHAERAGHGVRGTVSSVRMLKRGGVSVTLRFTAIERDRVVQLEPGKVVEVV